MAQPPELSMWRKFLEICIPYLGVKRRGEDPHPPGQAATTLKRALPGWQIFLIAVGGVIGVTIFSTHGEILKLAGPGGLLIATGFVAVTMICVMECIGELISIWPVSNAMVEYVRTFVDADLAIVVGIAYWYAQSAVFATLIIIAESFANEIASDAGRGILFYVVIPLTLFLINVLGVEYYGLVEGVGGIVKLLMVLSGIFFMVAEAPKAKTTNLDAGFYHQDGVARSDVEAICVAIPLLAYGYIGTEIVSVTAFEALDRRSLRFPARFVSYIIATLYFLSALLQSFLVNRDNPRLQSVEVSTNITSVGHTKRADSSTPPFDAVIVIAARTYASVTMGQYFDGCIIFFCISAANTALYAASRTLFGLTRSLAQDQTLPLILKPFRYFGIITPTRQVPLFALVFSALSFYWLVPLQLARGIDVSDLLVVLGTTACIGVIIVWAFQCLAFIRYYRWLAKFRDQGRDGQVFLPPKYNRWEPRPKEFARHAHRMFLSDFKLVPAVVGISGCFLIVFVLSTANWWNDGQVTLKKLATAYAGPVILTAIFLCLKAWNRRWWVKLPVDVGKLSKITANLERTTNLRSVPGIPLEAIENGSVENHAVKSSTSEVVAVETITPPDDSSISRRQGDTAQGAL